MIGNTIYRTQTTANSMAWAREHLHDAPHGSVFLVDKFLQAHGRQGRLWQILPGQLLITILLKPSILPLDKLVYLNMALSLGILEPFKAYGAQLKWPNDIVLQGKKLGGMIVEVVWHEQQPRGVILGFALNINTYFTPSHELFDKAISLSMLTSNVHDEEGIQNVLFSSINRWYATWESALYDKIFNAWKQEQMLVNTYITTHYKNGDVAQGIVRDFLPDGSLVLEIQGEEHSIQHYLVDSLTLE